MSNETFSLPGFNMTDYNLYRLDDRIFLAFIIAGLAFCLIHAARRAFRQPRPTEESPPDQNQPAADKDEEIERHTLLQRIYHWTNAAAVIILTISGWAIYQPQGPFALGQTPNYWFLWHQWGTAILLVGLVFHMIHESFMAKGANSMAVNQAEGIRLLAILKNFFGFSRSYPRASKYHPGQIIFHWLVAGNLFLLILTGSVIWKPFRELLPLSLLGLGWDFIFANRLLHDFFSATLMASLIGHVYFALFIKKNWPEAKSMFTGRISLREYLSSHFPMD